MQTLHFSFFNNFTSSKASQGIVPVLFFFQLVWEMSSKASRRIYYATLIYLHLFLCFIYLQISWIHTPKGIISYQWTSQILHTQLNYNSQLKKGKVQFQCCHTVRVRCHTGCVPGAIQILIQIQIHSSSNIPSYLVHLSNMGLVLILTRLSQSLPKIYLKNPYL